MKSKEMERIMSTIDISTMTKSIAQAAKRAERVPPKPPKMEVVKD